MNFWSVFVLNFLISLIVVKTTSFFLKENGTYFFISSFFVAEFEVCKSLVSLNRIGEIFCQLAGAIVVVCVCFKFVSMKKFLQIYFCYLLSLLVYSGLGFVFSYYLNINSAVLIFLSACILCFTISIVLKLSHRRKSVNNFCFQTKLKMGENSVECKAFLDTGNFLFDPITNKPVNLVNMKLLSELIKNFSLEKFLLEKDSYKPLKNAHYIPFKTLNGKNRILVFEIDQMTFNGKILNDVMLGVCFDDFDNSFGSDMILHNNFACV